MNFLFDDYETFNMSPRGGAPSQFAAIATGEDLSGSVTHNFFCSPSEDAFPEVGACLVTKQTPESVASQSVVHGDYDFIKRINSIMTRHPNTCVVGYNSKSFDDEWTRNLLFRNLMAPYEWHFKNGNSRFDAINLMSATYALRPSLLKWPYVDDIKDGEVVGKRVSLKLENLSKENDIVHINAHDALSDVEALIELMRTVKEGDPEFFEAVFQTRNKHHVLSLLSSLDSDKGLLYISRTQSKSKFISFVVPIGLSKNDKNVFYVWDTMVNPEKILALPKGQRERILGMKRSELEELGIDARGLIKIKLNGLPPLLNRKFIDKTTGARSGLNLHRDEIYGNRDLAITLRQDLMGLIEEVEASYCLPPLPEDYDHQIYGGGFFTPSENAFSKQIHAASDWGERLTITLSSAPTERTKQIALRMIGRNAPEVLTGDELAQWEEYKKTRFSGLHANSITDFKTNEILTAAGEIEKLSVLRGDLVASGDTESLLVVDSLIQYFSAKQ